MIKGVIHAYPDNHKTTGHIVQCMKNKPKATWISHVDLTATQQTQQQTRWLVRAEKSRANFSEKTAPVGFWGEISLCRKLTLLAFASYVIEQWLMYWERFIFSRDFSFLALCVIRALVETGPRLRFRQPTIWLLTRDQVSTKQWC